MALTLSLWALRPTSGMAGMVIAFGVLIATYPSATVSAANRNDLEEVVVSATKREENLQHVSLSVVALSGEALSSAQILATADLPSVTPGLLISTNASNGQAYIRGVGTDIVSPGTDPSVAVHIDGVYQPRGSQTLQYLYDIDRVEVVRGPQGALDGRNAVGGSINIISKSPEYGFHSSFSAQYGNYDHQRIGGAFNASLVDNMAAVRVAAMRVHRTGYSRNTLLRGSLDGETTTAYRARLRIDPKSDLSIVLGFDRTREDDTSNLAPKLNVDFPSPAVNVFGATVPTEPRIVEMDQPSGTRRNQDTVSATVTWKSDGPEVRSITAYTDNRVRLRLDLDATSVNFISNGVQELSREFSQELQVSSSSTGRISWMGDALYLREKASQDFQVLYAPIQAVTRFPISNVTDVRSLFGALSYHLDATTSATLGLRYSDERKRGEFVRTIDDPFGALTGVPGGGIFTQRASPTHEWKSLTPRISIEHQLRTDAMLYASIATGFKSGGFNLLGSGETFEPERIQSYEMGLKSTFLKNSLRLNASAFFSRYSDMQVHRFYGSSAGASEIITNAASAGMKGLEADLRAVFSKSLAVDVGFALLDARYRNFRSANPDAADSVVTQDLSGYTLPRAPKVSATIGLQGWLPVPASYWGPMMIRIDSRYQSSIWFDQFNSPGVREGGYWIWNAYATLGADDSSHWRLVFYGRNLGNRLYRQNVIRATSLLGTLDFWGAPRTFGAEIEFRR